MILRTDDENDPSHDHIVAVNIASYTQRHTQIHTQIHMISFNRLEC